MNAHSTPACKSGTDREVKTLKTSDKEIVSL